MSDYEDFLRLKFDFHKDYGFDIDPADLSPCLLPHQRDIVQWALKGGRRALFESFGLGKSIQQVDAHAFWRSNGNRPLTSDDLEGLTTAQRMKVFEAWTLAGIYDHQVHVELGEKIDGGKAGMGTLPATFMLLAPGSPHPDVWHDVNRMRTLNTEQSSKARVMHVCPLQFDIVDRLIGRFSMPGEIVFDPFAGLGTVPMRAVAMGREGRGVELNPGYFVDSVRYLQAAEYKAALPTLFDLIEQEVEIPA